VYTTHKPYSVCVLCLSPHGETVQKSLVFIFCRDAQRQRLKLLLPPLQARLTFKPQPVDPCPWSSGPVAKQLQALQRITEKACAPFLTGTEYVSSIWNSAGSSLLKVVREERRFKNIFSRSMFSPVTFEIWKIGHIL